MSIFSRTGEPPPSESLSRRLGLFADRAEITEHFISKINNADATTQILFLHGMGGNGKSLLLRFLQAKSSHVANALIDFGARPVGQQRPLEVLPALFILKRQLAEYKIKTPRFDFAAVNYLQKSGLSYKQILPELFPGDELELALSIGEFLSGLPFVSTGKAIFKIFEERTHHALERWKMAKAIEKEHVARILEAPADPVLADLLPYYFAADLNAAITKTGPRSRIVLFCDTHEAFWGEDAFPTAGGMSLAALARDKWLRILLGYLNLESGIVVVVAGRKPPRWSQAEEATIPDEWVDVRHIAGLSSADARWYLDQVGVTARATQDLVISYASGSPDEVHPYMLGLCADVIASQGTSQLDVGAAAAPIAADLSVRRRLLVSRLMSSVSEDVQRQVVAVAASRSFDYQCFAFLARELDFAGSRGSFSRLVNFSFIMESANADPEITDPAREVYSVHQLLRRELGTMFPADSARAHQALVEFYEQRPDPAARAEAILQRSHVDVELGVRLWRQAMDDCLSAGQYAQCQTLIGVVQDIPVAAADRSSLFYDRVARAYLGVGALAEAAALCEQLEPMSVEAILLRADIEFYHCEFETAERIAREGLTRMAGADKDRLSLRLAEILLYRGEFGAARAALDSISHLGESGAGAAGLPWTMLSGEVDLFSGDLETAERKFGDCAQRVAAASNEESDLTVRAWSLADQGLLHLVRAEWAEAIQDATSALRLRDSATHARGIANSLYIAGSARCGAGEHEQGRIDLGRAGKLARDQGDEVTLAKIRQSEGMSRFATGDVTGAIELLTEAEEGTRKWGVPYDYAHALLDLALVRRAADDYRAMTACLDEARTVLARHDFGLLGYLYPEATRPPADRVLAGLIAFAAGDALGAPWEGLPPGEIAFEPGDALPQRADWPVGSTTDDTSQLLVAARALVEPGSRPLAEVFLTRLAAELPLIRGLGPTTPKAVERFLRTGELVAAGGATNGGVIRALAVGWAVPVSKSAVRRELVGQLTASTHGSPEALVCARIVAALGSWALEGAGSEALAEVVLTELAELAGDLSLPPERERLIRSAALGDWVAPATGIAMEAADTLAAAIAIILRPAADPAGAMVAAVRLGGDTDSVASLAGGILGSRSAGSPELIPWLTQVRLPDLTELTAVAGALARYRFSHYD